MKTKLLILCLSILTILSACSDDDIVTETIPCGTTSSSQISFSNPVVGQTSKYLLLEGQNYFDEDDNFNFEYSGDTLILKIEEILSDGRIVISENLTEESSGQKLTEWGLIDIQQPHFFEVLIQNDSIQFISEIGITPTSLFFINYFNSIPLPKNNLTTNLTTIEGWKTGLGYCECYNEGFANETDLLNVTYPHLNIVVQNKAMQVDGPGHTFIYNAEKGIVRYSIYSWWTQEGLGWDLLPED